MFPDPLSYPPSVAGADAAALKATASELAGDEAASSAPMPAPLPNTSRPPAAIVTSPLPDKRARGGDVERAAADGRPAVVCVRAAEGQFAAAGKCQRIVPMMFPAKLVEPADIATVNVGTVYSGGAGSSQPPRPSRSAAHRLRDPGHVQHAAGGDRQGRRRGRLSPLPSSSTVPAEIVVGPLYVLVPLRSRLPVPN